MRCGEDGDGDGDGDGDVRVGRGDERSRDERAVSLYNGKSGCCKGGSCVEFIRSGVVRK